MQNYLHLKFPLANLKTFSSVFAGKIVLELPPPQALNNELKFLCALIAHTLMYRDQRLQRETNVMRDGKPPPPITAELYNFLYSLINDFNLIY